MQIHYVNILLIALFPRHLVPTFGGYFENGVEYECFAPNVLNLGVSPSMLLEIVSNRFRSAGGTVREFTRLNGVVVSESIGAALDVSVKEGEIEPITARLVLDCMGNASPISAQQVGRLFVPDVCDDAFRRFINVVLALFIHPFSLFLPSATG